MSFFLWTAVILFAQAAVWSVASSNHTGDVSHAYDLIAWIVNLAGAAIALAIAIGVWIGRL